MLNSKNSKGIAGKPVLDIQVERSIGIRHLYIFLPEQKKKSLNEFHICQKWNRKIDNLFAVKL